MNVKQLKIFTGGGVQNNIAKPNALPAVHTLQYQHSTFALFARCGDCPHACGLLALAH
jgi:hypothetical protein